MFNSRKVRELEWENRQLQREIVFWKAKIDILNKEISNYDDNLDYLVEKEVLSGPLNELIVKFIKMKTNLRKLNFPTSISEAENYEDYCKDYLQDHL